MSTAEQDSSLQIVLPPMRADATSPSGFTMQPHAPAPRDASTTSTAAADAAAAGLWLNGDVLSCACPECHGPMSIRLWLMMADCWMCGASIELTEEQERVARKLLEAKKTPATPAPTIPGPAGPPLPPASPIESRVKPAPPHAKPSKSPSIIPSSAPAEVPPGRAGGYQTQTKAASPPARLSAPAGPITKAALARRGAHDWFRDLPAWLVSLIFHIVAMLLLGLLTIAQNEHKPHEIVLAATMGTAGTEGGEKKEDEHEDAVAIEDPGPEQAPEPMPTIEEPPPPPEPPPPLPPQPKPPRQEPLITREDRNARELPKIEDVREALVATASQRMFEGRDPRIRTQMVLAEGGSMYTEAAVAQGLYWLSRHQSEDGHWSLDHFDHDGDCDGRCSGLGDGHSDVGATGLALLPFLGAGQTHNRGIYKNNVERGLAWLLAQQKPNGDLRGEGTGRMYAHGIASIALCEAYALTGDDYLKTAAQRAIDYIVRAQHKGGGRNTGGWRYAPNEQGDTSVIGWQLMALRSGRMGGLRVPSNSFMQASKYLDYVQQGRYGGLYSYQRSRSPEPAMIAEGLLCRQYLGWPASHRGLNEGVNYLMAEHLPSRGEPNIYYWYYGTQVMHHLGGDVWQQWNDAMRDALVELQERSGHEAGSWSPIGGAIGGHDTRVGGRVYVTSLAICTLEVYYRHLPIYRAIEIEPEE